MKKRLSFLFAAILLMLLMLSACGSNNQTTAKSDPATQTSNTDATTGKVIDIKVAAKDFEFDKKEIHVKQGDKVRITLQSDDGGHGFAIPAYNVDIQGNNSAEFTADKKGTFDYHCSILCGTGHTEMTGKLIVD